MLDGVTAPYKILLPVWVFKSANCKEDITNNARKYVEKAFPEREFVEVEGHYAICKSKNKSFR